MIFKQFNIGLIIQVILIGITTSIFSWTFSMDYMLITRYTLVVVWIIQLIVLIRYIDRINRDLQKFLDSIRFKDTTFKFTSDNTGPFRDLHESFEEVISAFGQVRIEKEHEHHFFQTTIEHVDVGLIAFDESGQIKLCNKAAKRLFNIKSLVNIESLKAIKSDLPLILEKLLAGHPVIYNLSRNMDLLKLSLNATDIKISDKIFRLISIQNITNELEQGEMDAWQKLIRVITHEIMNSVSPITLLSSGLINLFEKDGEIIPKDELDNESLKETVSGLKVIKNRSKSLSAFVEEYRNSMQIPAPKFEAIKLTKLVESLGVLFKEELAQKNISFTFKINDDDIINADSKLIEQVLINIMNNAIHFCKETEDPKISIVSDISDTHSLISVSDNGPGIDNEIIDQIFIPFFSTKEKGTGIGLSLSRQIMRMHNGSISVQSDPNKGSIFTLYF